VWQFAAPLAGFGEMDLDVAYDLPAGAPGFEFRHPGRVQVKA
jgi:hypothetical protein